MEVETVATPGTCCEEAAATSAAAIQNVEHAVEFEEVIVEVSAAACRGSTALHD